MSVPAAETMAPANAEPINTASGPDGALRRFGAGRKGEYDLRRV